MRRDPNTIRPADLGAGPVGGVSRRLTLDGRFDRPITLSGIRGTRTRPVIVDASAGTTLSLNRASHRADGNGNAWRRQEGGYYPSVGQVADQAGLMLFDCQFVVVIGLHFKDCWPTGIYLDRSCNIAVLDCEFEGGTIAVAANGPETRDILVENCSWTQDDTLWEDITWSEVHGSYESSDRGVARGSAKGADRRDLDGDFFRAWNVAGDVTLRNNTIRDCFNAIHFFNSVDFSGPADRGGESVIPKYNNGRRASANVLIEGNVFERVRDNCIEPEDYAWNWVVRDNVFTDCYGPYSFELDRAAWIYVYDNRHLLTGELKPDPNGRRDDYSGFKLGERQSVGEGDIYVMNNSWLAREDFRLFRGGAVKRLKHRNNAVKVMGAGADRGHLFGKGKFTKDWWTNDISFGGDLVDDGRDRWSYWRQMYPVRRSVTFAAFDFACEKQVSGLKVVSPSHGHRGATFQVRLPGHDMAALSKNGSERAYRMTLGLNMTLGLKGTVGFGMDDSDRTDLDRGLAFLGADPVEFPDAFERRPRYWYETGEKSVPTS